MIDLIDEVQADLEQEKLSKVIKLITRYFVIIACCVVLGVSGYIFWKNQFITSQKEASKIFESALIDSKNNKLDKTEQELEKIIANKISGYWELASFKIANIYQYKDIDKFERYLNDIASSSKHRSFSEVAALKLANFFLETNNLEKASLYVSKIDQNKGILRYSAMQITALIYMIKEDNKKAIEILSSLINNQLTPLKIKSESEVLLSVLNNK